MPSASRSSGRRPTHGSTEIRGGHTAHLRRANLERVQAFVMEQRGPFTRAELIEATGLSAPTVGRLIRDLIDGGLVLQAGPGPSRGGRRPLSMEFNGCYGFVAAVALDSTRTRVAVGDLRGERLAHHTVSTPKTADPPEMLEQVAAAVRFLLQEAGVPEGRLLAVSLGSPGVVDPATGTVLALAPALGHWSNVKAGPILSDALGAPVHVENDVNLAVVGEHWRGAARDHATCAYIEVGRGIGAGILIEGALHRGYHLLAGEISFMCMGPDYVDEDFEDGGCLETLAGLNALAARWPDARGDAEGWVGELYHAARAGNREAREAVEAVATLVGIAVANLSLVIDPSLIVVGGELALADSPFLEHVRRTTARIVPTPTPIVTSTLGKEAALWGGLLTATAHARARLHLDAANQPGLALAEAVAHDVLRAAGPSTRDRRPRSPVG